MFLHSGAMNESSVDLYWIFEFWLFITLVTCKLCFLVSCQLYIVKLLDNCWQCVASLLSGPSICLHPLLSTKCQMSHVLGVPGVPYSSSQMTNNNPLIYTWYQHNLHSSSVTPRLSHTGIGGVQGVMFCRSSLL